MNLCFQFRMHVSGVDPGFPEGALNDIVVDSEAGVWGAEAIVFYDT